MFLLFENKKQLRSNKRNKYKHENMTRRQFESSTVLQNNEKKII